VYKSIKNLLTSFIYDSQKKLFYTLPIQTYSQFKEVKINVIGNEEGRKMTIFMLAFVSLCVLLMGIEGSGVSTTFYFFLHTELLYILFFTPFLLFRFPHSLDSFDSPRTFLLPSPSQDSR